MESGEIAQQGNNISNMSLYGSEGLFSTNVASKDQAERSQNENQNQNQNQEQNQEQNNQNQSLNQPLEDIPAAPARTQKKRKKKVEMACVYCRRSHMICDESRPCQRCIKRGIGHLCYDEPSNKRQRQKVAQFNKTTNPGTTGTDLYEQQPTNAFNPANQLGQKAEPAAATVYDSIGLKQQQQQQQPLINNSVLSQTLPYNSDSFFYSEHAGSEFSSLNDFLSMIDDPELVNNSLNDNANLTTPLASNVMARNGPTTGPDAMIGFAMNSNDASAAVTAATTTNQIPTPGNRSLANLLAFSQPQLYNNNNQNSTSTSNPNSNPNQAFQHSQPQPPHQEQLEQQKQQQDDAQRQLMENFLHKQVKPQSHQPVISDSARDKFFLTAADPTTEISPEERLKQVIKAKLDAGLLQPYHYATGYARLHRYMDNYMNVSSRQRILKPLSIFRPAFRAIARTLKDVDLVLVEESFERMLLDYDRVFTSMAIPACLWRRTGEIYRGNKEFATLVGVLTDDLKDGKLAIYELMSEESAVNFWEKYGAIAFDKGQKAVLTSCNLRTKDGIKRKSCCFSFTIRRDRYNIPSCIVGNFIPIDPSN